MTPSLRSLRVFSLIWLLIASAITSCRAGEPPLVNLEFESPVRAQLMGVVKITCPVRQSDDQSELMFNWIKDNESISAAWTRFRQNGPHLRIVDVEMQDSGTYTCRAVNGYGNQEVNIQLIVTDDHQLSESTSDSPVADGESDGDEEEEDETDGNELEDSIGFEEFDSSSRNQTRLNFTDDTLRQPTLLRVTTRSSFEIQCDVIEYPYPVLRWLKNGKEYAGSQPSKLDDKGRTISRYPLFIRRATMETSGNYTCLARGPNDRIQITFNIQVFDIQKMMPNMSQVDPTSNTTVLRGGKVILVCRVTSPTKPDVEWLKILPLVLPHKGQLHSNTSLIYGDDQYQTMKLSSDELSRRDDGSFKLELIMNPLHESNAGSYMCLSRNNYGYNLESMHLFVKLNYETEKNKSVPLSIMVALPSALILSIAGGFVCWVREREKQRRREVAAAAAAAAGIPSRNNLASAAATAAALEASAHRLSTCSSNRVGLMSSGGGGGGGSVASSRRQSSSGNDESSLVDRASKSCGTGTERVAGKQQQQQQQRGSSRSSLDHQQQQQTPNHYFERRHHNHPRVTNTSSSLV